jgi:hypothetical protein
MVWDDVYTARLRYNGRLCPLFRLGHPATGDSQCRYNTK